MKVVPRYNLLPGTEIALLNRPMVVTGQSAEGYKVTGLEDGAASVISFAKLVEYLKLPGAKIDTATPQTGARLKQRLGGYSTAEALSDEQRELGRFTTRSVGDFSNTVRRSGRRPGIRISSCRTGSLIVTNAAVMSRLSQAPSSAIGCA